MWGDLCSNAQRQSGIDFGLADKGKVVHNEITYSAPSFPWLEGVPRSALRSKCF